jgi:hypothetical protein
MKRITILLACLAFSVFAQNETRPTDEFKVTGLVKQELTISLADIGKLQSKSIPDVIITNHLGEKKSIATKLSGALIKDLLKDISFKEDSPKLLSEFYLVFIANDGYTVVFSWNEIFNSPTGDNLYVITARDGKTLQQMDERILVLTPTDFKTGRRHIKGLNKIVVGRVSSH